MLQKARELKQYKIKTPFLQELMWFHRIKSDQDKELLALEFLNVCASHALEGKLFDKALKTVRYNKAIQVRNILYNFPELEGIVKSSKEESEKWEEIEQLLKDKIERPFDYGYLKERFASVDIFYHSVSLLRNASLGMDNSRRWTSKFLFPFSFKTLFVDVNNKKEGFDIDRRFFSRGGEILYLMISRAKNSDTLKELMVNVFQNSEENRRWNDIYKVFEGKNKDVESETTLGFLSVESHAVFDRLVDDLIILFRSNIAHNDFFYYFSSIASFYMVHYILTIAQEHQNSTLLKDGTNKVVYPIELLAPKSDHIRRASRQIYKINEDSPIEALKIALTDYFVTLEDITDKDVLLKKLNDDLNYRNEKEDDYEEINLSEIQSRVWQKIYYKVKNELLPIHRVLLKGVGLASVKKTNSYRYLASDEWLKTLVLINVDSRMPFNDFVDKLYEEYGFIISNRHSVLLSDAYAENDFKKNENRLFDRLKALGLLENKSDGYAYVINRYGRVK